MCKVILYGLGALEVHSFWTPNRYWHVAKNYVKIFPIKTCSKKSPSLEGGPSTGGDQEWRPSPWCPTEVASEAARGGRTSSTQPRSKPQNLERKSMEVRGMSIQFFPNHRESNGRIKSPYINIIEKLWLVMVLLLNLRMYSRGSSRLEHETDWSLLMRRSEKNVPSCVATWHGWMKSMDSKSFFQTVTERPDLLPQYLDAAKDSYIQSPNLQMLGQLHPITKSTNACLALP